MANEPPVSTPVALRPELRWRSHVHDLPAIERELGRMWSGISLTTSEDGVEERRVAARSSVLNLVVIGARPEIGERCGDAIVHLTGRHPSRTLIVLPSDPDGPSWIDAEIEAHCVLPREGASETCSERIYLKAGGEAGRHPAAIVAPLVIHDLPVTLWWPGDVPFGSDACSRLLRLADRLVVDGSSWSGDGLAALREMVALLDRPDLELSDFALIRQSRWREAIASSFDAPDVQPFLRSLRRIDVTYGSGPSASSGPVNVIKPLYHVAWLASRLGMDVEEPLRAVRARSGARKGSDAGFEGVLRQGRRRVAVVLRPEASPIARGTTLRVAAEALRRGIEFRVAVTAGRDTVMVDAWRNGQSFRHRPFPAPRRTEVDMLAEVIESVGRNRLAVEAIRMAAALVSGRGRSRTAAQ
jgi:hypothetical protein